MWCIFQLQCHVHQLRLFFHHWMPPLINLDASIDLNAPGEALVSSLFNTVNVECICPQTPLFIGVTGFTTSGTWEFGKTVGSVVNLLRDRISMNRPCSCVKYGARIWIWQSLLRWQKFCRRTLLFYHRNAPVLSGCIADCSCKICDIMSLNADGSEEQWTSVFHCDPVEHNSVFNAVNLNAHQNSPTVMLIQYWVDCNGIRQ